MKFPAKPVLITLWIACSGHAMAATHDPLGFGAAGDGKTVCTAAIQGALDKAAAAGGGVVAFSKPGTYLSGAIFVKSHTELQVVDSVTLRGLQDGKAYPELWTRVAGLEMKWPAALVNVINAKDAKLTGSGTIDGDGSYWWEKFWGKDGKGGMMADYQSRGLRWAVDYDCKRVRLIQEYQPANVLIDGLRLERSGFWTVHLCFSENLICSGRTIRNNIGGLGPNSDGIDVDSSRGVLIEKCEIDFHDDNIVLKAGRDADGLRVNLPTENVGIRDCIAREGYGMITLSSETSGWIRNVKVNDCKAIGTKHGLFLKSARVRGGGAENIEFENLERGGVEFAFAFNLNRYPACSYPVIAGTTPVGMIQDHWKVLTTKVEPEERGIPEYRNIRFENITIKCAGKAFEVVAHPEKPMRDFTCKDANISTGTAGSISDAANWRFEDFRLHANDGNPATVNNRTGVKLPVNTNT